MGTTKSYHFTVKQNTISTINKALGHPARMAIFEHLIKVDNCICNDIVNEIPLSQPTVSQHLQELRNAGLIKGNIEGNTICYCINKKTVKKIQNYFDNILDKVTNKKMKTNKQNFYKMKNSTRIKEVVRKKYSKIALGEKKINTTSCCTNNSCCNDNYSIMNDEYSTLGGYNPEADLQLGCGLPTKFAKIKKGDVVVDLGSGAGNDCFVAKHETGDTGKVIGIDFSKGMIEKAQKNTKKLNYNNIEFKFGDIEKIPLSDNIADVVVSNCVMNLVPDKSKAFSEVHRILKTGGHFSISDIVLRGNLPEKIKKSAEMYAGCVSGAIQKDDYVNIIKKAGFKNISLQKEKTIIIPNNILKNYLNEDEIDIYNSNKNIIFSITIYGEKL